MISCTEFIPAYSELFTFLEERYGREEVSNFWKYLFAPTGDGIPLINHVLQEGIRGCYTYWSGTLNEEAADFTMYLNEKAGWFMIAMHHCPSKGRLLRLQEEEGLVPYHDYCLHCEGYRAAVEKIGLKYMYDFTPVDHAACTLMIYDPKVFDGRFVVDENTLVMDRKAADNEYFHRDFHSSMNMGIHYLGENYGEEVAREYLVNFVKKFYAKRLAGKSGLATVAEVLTSLYEKEKATDALTLTEQDGTLVADIAYCPAVRHLHSTGRVVSPYYRMTKEVVMQTLAEMCGVSFTMTSYDEATGASSYRFI